METGGGEPPKRLAKMKKRCFLSPADCGRPDYLQKLKVPEGYDKIIDYSNNCHGTVDDLIAKGSFTRTMCTVTNSFSAVSKLNFARKYAFE